MWITSCICYFSIFLLGFSLCCFMIYKQLMPEENKNFHHVLSELVYLAKFSTMFNMLQASDYFKTWWEGLDERNSNKIKNGINFLSILIWKDVVPYLLRFISWIYDLWLLVIVFCRNLREYCLTWIFVLCIFDQGCIFKTYLKISQLLCINWNF